MSNFELTKKHLKFGYWFWSIFLLVNIINVLVISSGFNLILMFINLYLFFSVMNELVEIDSNYQSRSKKEWVEWWIVRSLTIVLVPVMVHYLI